MTAKEISPGPGRVVCVTGMHRSGTSFTAHALQLLGVSLGSVDRMMAPGPDNPAGYWENRDIKELNDAVLSRLSGSWDQPPVFRRGWEQNPSLDPLRERAADVLDEAFGAVPAGQGLIGWKDPRISLLLPFWRTVTPIETTIVLVRDPAEVAASLRARNGIDEPQAAMLWLRYLFAATADDPGHLLVRHQDFFEDLPGTLEAVANHLGLPRPDQGTVANARTHLDPSLRHHVAPTSPPVDDNPLFALAAAVWNRGSVDLRAISSVVTEAIRWGWLRPPIDGELLARTRAQMVEMRDRIRQRRRQERREQNAASSSAEPSGPPSSVRVGDGSSQSEDVSQ
jgi:hypothetical protein